MSTDRDTTRLVRSWLEEGVTALPDRVLDAVLDQLPATPQRRLLERLRRFPTMNNPVRYAIAAAAVVAIALVGYQFLPPDNGTGGPTTPTPTATPAPLAPSPSPAGAPTLPLTTDLEPGAYRPYPELDLTFEAPGGWATCCESPAGIIWNGEEPPNSATIFFEDFTEITVYDDPCNWGSGVTSEPTGAEAVAQALAEREGTEAQDVTVGGLSGFHVQLLVPGDLKIEPQGDGDATFLECDDGEYRHYTGPGGARYAQHLEQIEDLYIVDVDGKTIAFDLSHFPETADADLEAIEAMLASVEMN
jgi:hypothetical protein